MLVVTEHIRIPLREFEWNYVRSSGAGGQNVNKVNSKAILSWKPLASPFLSADVKTRFQAKFGHRLNHSGVLQIQSDRFRDQPRNAADCTEKLKEMLLLVAYAPKKRKKTKPTRASKEKRLDGKRRNSDKKQNRKVRLD